MRKISVKGYSYKRKGKTIFVKPHTRNCEGSSGAGEEFSSLKKSNGLVMYDKWEDFQSDVNKVGWENMTLAKGYGYRYKIVDGKKTLNRSDPRADYPENKYLGFRVRGKLVGTTNVYVGEDNIEVSNFEIFPKYKRKGYGRKFFNTIRKQYPDKTFMLRWGNRNAKKFWESMGFKSDKKSRWMEL